MKKEELSAGKVTIGKLLSKDYFFAVPNYQRPFSWEQQNFEDLADDIITADHDASYFLGTFVLHLRNKENSEYDIVDGQQRLTSLLVLLACLRDTVENQEFKSGAQNKIVEPKNVVDGIDERKRVDVRDRKFFDELIIKPEGTKSAPSFKTKPDPLRRYLLAIKVFSERIEKLPQKEIEDIISFISQKCVVVVLATEDFDEAFRLFAIVNDRGKQLRRIDVLKATNIGPDLISSESTRDKVASDWENLENDIGEDTFESIFYLLRLSLLKDKPQGDLLREFEDRIFKAKIIQKGQVFLDRVFKYAETYRSVFIDRDAVPLTDKNYNKYRAMIHIMDAEFKASEWRAAVVSFVEQFKGKKLFEFLLQLEKLFLDQWLNAVRKDERYAAYSALLNKIESAKNPSEVIASIKYDADAIRQSIVDARAYGSSYCKYILLRLEVATAEHDKVNEFDAKSIEHVLPQDPDDNSDWLKVHDREDLEQYVHSFGNLVLLSKGKNSAAKNFELKKKQDKYLEKRVSDYPRSIQVLNAKEWTRDTIKSRTKEAADLVLKDP